METNWPNVLDKWEKDLADLEHYVDHPHTEYSSASRFEIPEELTQLPEFLRDRAQSILDRSKVASTKIAEQAADIYPQMAALIEQRSLKRGDTHSPGKILDKTV